MDPRCLELDRVIESIAAGEVDPGPGQAAHLSHCARCAAALALARQVHRLLDGMPLEPAPPAFTTGVARRLRREWWRTERHLDWWFNATVAAALTCTVAGVVLLVNLSGLSAVLADVSRLLMSAGRPIAERAATLARDRYGWEAIAAGVARFYADAPDRFLLPSAG
jgi:hypothetical protein